MLQVSDETKQAFLSDSTDKQLSIEFEGLTPEDINCFTKIGYHGIKRTSINFTQDGEVESRFFFYREDVNNLNGTMIRLTDCVDHTYYENYRYWYYSFYPKLDNDDECIISGGTANVTLSDAEIGLVYYKNGVYNTMYFPIDNSHLEELRNQTYWVKFFTDRFLPTFDDNNKLWELCIKVNVKVENVRLNSGSNSLTVSWGGKADNIMFTLSDVAPEQYVYPVFKPSEIVNGVYPTMKPYGIDSTEEINYFTGTTYIFPENTGSSADITDGGTKQLWDSMYCYSEGGQTYTQDFRNCVNGDKLSQFSKWGYSVDVTFKNRGITGGTANIDFIGPLQIRFRYVLNGSSYYTYKTYTDPDFIQRFANGETLRLSAYTSSKFNHIDNDNYFRGVRCYFDVNFSDVELYEGYSSVYYSYDIVFDNFMINFSNEPYESYVFPPYSKSQIINGVYPILNLHNEDLVGESFTLTESICSQDNIKFGLCESSNCSFDIINRTDKFNDLWFRVFITCNNTEKVPLGRFKIKNVKKQTKNNMRITKITAYDEMVDWDKDVKDWYSLYMFNMPYHLKLSDTQSVSIEFVFSRQMFSTYYNFAKMLGYETDANYGDTLIYSCSSNKLEEHYTGFEMTYKVDKATDPNWNFYDHNVYLYDFEITDISSDYLYKFDKINGGDFPVGATDEQVMQDSYFADDSEGRQGFLTNASVMVIETLDTNLPHPKGHSSYDTSVRRYLVNAGDYFAVSDNCIKLTIRYGCKLHKYKNINGTWTELKKKITDSVYLYKTPCPQWIKNLPCKSFGLLYFNVKSGEIQQPASCTIRDVFRSLFEINGAFIRVNRYGNIEALYPTKNSLYPSETLYPSEELYPRVGTNIIPMSRYISSEIEDFESADFGKIQFVSPSTVEDGITLITYDDHNQKDSTYIIDDNVFVTNVSTTYDKVYPMNIFMSLILSRIENMDYTPHETDLRGLPWIEVGDRLALMTNDGGFETFIFRRTLKGIQALRDTYEAKGDDIIEAHPDDKILEY